MTREWGSPTELMCARACALFIHEDPVRIQSINQWNGGVAPRFYLGRTAAGSLCRMRTDVPDDLAEKLQSLCAGEPGSNPLSRAPQYRNEYIRLLASQAPIEHIWTGPAYLFPADVVPGSQTVAVNQDNFELLRGGFEEWIPDVPHRQPFVAALVEGRVVSICASVRITAAAHEAGVETLPARRRKGHAVNAVAGWAVAVRKMGATPFYSTSWDNIASQRVAAKLGLIRFGVDFHIT